MASISRTRERRNLLGHAPPDYADGDYTPVVIIRGFAGLDNDLVGGALRVTHHWNRSGSWTVAAFKLSCTKDL